MAAWEREPAPPHRPAGLPPDLRVMRVGPEKKHVPEKRVKRLQRRAEKKLRQAAEPKKPTKRQVRAGRAGALGFV